MDVVEVVTPFAGVWIEIKLQKENEKLTAVTPFAGVWIEIRICKVGISADGSHSLRGSVD